MEPGYAPFEYAGILFGHFQAEVCKSCHEAFFERDSARQIEKAIKRLNLLGVGIRMPEPSKAVSLLAAFEAKREPMQIIHLRNYKAFFQPTWSSETFFEGGKPWRKRMIQEVEAQ